MYNTSRRSGILLAVSSLAGQGAFGKEAYKFIDFLVEAGQSLWQTLPIGPVGESLSPYQSRSAFAGNPDFIDRSAIRRDPGRYAAKGARYNRFLKENDYWLQDYALFEAVRESQGCIPLFDWPDELRNPSSKTLPLLREKFKEEIIAVINEQYCFFAQWQELKNYANLKGIGIIGDLPIYVYEDSADFWLRRKAFHVDKYGRPASSAGVPPDAFSKEGQLWNNPVYDWEKNRKLVFDFWRDRFTQALSLYDGVRIDHFRGFADFFEVPLNTSSLRGTSATKQSNATSPELSQSSGSASSLRGVSATKQSKTAIPSARHGKWRPGPGIAFTDMIKKEYPGLFVIAEDLGNLSDTAKKLVIDCGFPGMSVLQFAFTKDSKNPHLPHNIKENSVCYTGTHDNDTTLGWARSATKKELRFAMEYLGLSNPGDLPGALIAAVLASKANIAVIPLQDWLGLGSEARLNTPSTEGGSNWKWKIPRGALTRSLAKRILHATKDLYNRG